MADYSRHLREHERDNAEQLRHNGDPLVLFALEDIQRERVNWCKRNVQRRINRKLLSGGMFVPGCLRDCKLI